jgi:hypothetical protein
MPNGYINGGSLSGLWRGLLQILTCEALWFSTLTTTGSRHHLVGSSQSRSDVDRFLPRVHYKSVDGPFNGQQ